MMEITMESTANNKLTKWGVRLIACYFVVWGVSDFYRLVTGTRNNKGFLGFDLGLTYNGKHVDVIAWLGVAVLLYAGYRLLRFRSSGYDLALIIFWLSFFAIGYSLVWLTILLNSNPSDWTNFSFSVDPTSVKSVGGIKNTILVQLLVGTFFLLHPFVLYFLYRKDTKALFNISSSTREKH